MAIVEFSTLMISAVPPPLAIRTTSPSASPSIRPSVSERAREREIWWSVSGRSSCAPQTQPCPRSSLMNTLTHARVPALTSTRAHGRPTQLSCVTSELVSQVKKPCSSESWTCRDEPEDLPDKCCSHTHHRRRASDAIAASHTNDGIKKSIHDGTVKQHNENMFSLNKSFFRVSVERGGCSEGCKKGGGGHLGENILLGLHGSLLMEAVLRSLIGDVLRSLDGSCAQVSDGCCAQLCSGLLMEAVLRSFDGSCAQVSDGSCAQVSDGCCAEVLMDAVHRSFDGSCAQVSMEAVLRSRWKLCSGLDGSCARFLMEAVLRFLMEAVLGFLMEAVLRSRWKLCSGLDRSCAQVSDGSCAQVSMEAVLRSRWKLCSGLDRSCAQVPEQSC
ncbi:hypothetical protein DNTS_009827 [Danionella cerebrum]|uniref:Uncharacterized protein n=1 Tax=Danionella cerebrum TaxID=2873325 RepID=A0A553MXN3_9TELE|nr:hypothetical protein DNTS_009827 [Danionella translucida]